MRTQCFDAAVDFSCQTGKKPAQVEIILKHSSVPALLDFYPLPPEGSRFVQVATSLPVNVKWRDRFEIRDIREKYLRGTGIVLNPASRKTNASKSGKMLAFLQQLNGDKKEMLLALSLHNGVKGLTQKEISQFCEISETAQVALAQELEAEGEVKILAFSPLFILAQSSFDFINQRIQQFVQELQEKQADFIGIPPQKISRRFGLHPKILGLSLGYLERTGKVQQSEGRIIPAGFTPRISPDEEELLGQMEKLSLKGEFQMLSLQEMRRRFRLSAAKMDRMLALLVERKKVVKGMDGFMLHARWLDEIITKIKDSGVEEITVKDFKEMTGLTRKYAIPLLELLDQMGVTRRVGSTREVL